MIVRPIAVIMVLAVAGSALAQAPAVSAPATNPAGNEKITAARDAGLAWLTKNQAKDGSWGNQYTIAVTSFACLSYLASADEPFSEKAGESGKALVRGLEYLLSKQKDGKFEHQGHTWIHGQGFGTLALSEAYGRTLLCKTKPDIDARKLREAIAKAVKVIADNQSDSGGWWYTQGSKGQHEGSTTVTAVQALVSAANFGIEIDEDCLDKGFAYLKKCQNNDGGFDYQLDNSPDTTSMKEGTAANVATLALMKKFDQQVMMNAHKFLIKTTPQAVSKERFPYYGHFYGCMGMKLLGEEIKSLREACGLYVAAAQVDVLSWQDKDGAFKLQQANWVKQNSKETDGYSTAFATLLLSVGDARLSIFSRKPPKLPKAEG
ncbi:MAG: prenyltransferase/squalene oxidase repeat-containing protein [Phycisphaerae bacterium]